MSELSTTKHGYTVASFTLEFLSLATLKLLHQAAQLEQADYAMAAEVPQEEHDALAAKVESIRQAIASHR